MQCSSHGGHQPPHNTKGYQNFFRNKKTILYGKNTSAFSLSLHCIDENPGKAA